MRGVSRSRGRITVQTGGEPAFDGIGRVKVFRAVSPKRRRNANDE